MMELLFLLLCIGCQFSNHTETLKICSKATFINVDSIVNNVDDSKYDTVLVSSYELSSEGSEFIGFYDKKNRLCKLKVTHFGEMGKICHDYYFYNDSLIFKKLLTYNYDKPFYEKGYKTTIDSSSYNCIISPIQCNDSTFYNEKAMFLKNKK